MEQHWETVEGKVEQVMRCFGEDKKPRPVDKLQLILDEGIKGDLHSGARLADVCERRFLSHGLMKGIQVANVRQISAISVEELDEIGKRLQLPEKIPALGHLGENLVISGIPHFTQIPCGSLMFFLSQDAKPRSAVIAVWGENLPCGWPGKQIQRITGFRHIGGIEKRFPKASIGLRGIVGFVYASGVVKAGDKVRVLIPLQKPYRTAPV